MINVCNLTLASLKVPAVFLSPLSQFTLDNLVTRILCSPVVNKWKHLFLFLFLICFLVSGSCKVGQSSGANACLSASRWATGRALCKCALFSHKNSGVGEHDKYFTTLSIQEEDSKTESSVSARRNVPASWDTNWQTHTIENTIEKFMVSNKTAEPKYTTCSQNKTAVFRVK